MAAPRLSHSRALVHLLRYLAGTPNLGITFTGAQKQREAREAPNDNFELMPTGDEVSTLGAPDLFKLHNQTAAYSARQIIRLVGIRLGFSGWNRSVRGKSKVMVARSGRSARKST